MPNPLPMIVAHRGLHTSAAENSLEAFVAADRAGIRWVECDVWPSADNAAVVIHDPTLERITGNAGEVREQTLKELQAMGLPSLKQVVDALNDLSAPGLVVEIKPRMNRAFVGSVMKTLSRYDGISMVQSFHEDNIVRAWAIASTAHAAILVETAQELKNAVERGWPFINAHYSLVDEELVNRLHSTGRRIGAWTVNEADDIRRIIRLGVDMVITDDPEFANKS